ncbi:MAG: hypothetical protein AAGJ08_24305 [Cyanobacteria bacterium P01_H01_bin.35]
MSEEVNQESAEEGNKGIPVYGDWKEPRINNPSIVHDSNDWRGGNTISVKLLICLEALRDLTLTMENLSKFDKPSDEKRLVKQLASPLYNLASGVRDMFNELESNVKSYKVITSEQHKEIVCRKKQFLLDVPTDKKSDLRVVRDKIDSHVDKDAVTQPEYFWGKVNLHFFLKLVRHCLEQIVYLLSLDIYAWTRESGHLDIWSIMNVDGTLVDLYMQNYQPKAIQNITFVKSPKYGVENEIINFVCLYNKVASKCEDILMRLENKKAD